jgi:plastocyanin
MAKNQKQSENKKNNFMLFFSPSYPLFIKRLKDRVILFFVFTAMCSFAQVHNTCGQFEVTENWLQKHPEYRSQYELFQSKSVEEGIKSSQNKTSQTTSAITHTIPVVFHILHIGGPENISDAQVLDQMKMLNRDFQKQNADTISVVSNYTNNIANVGFEFQLAKIDPFGMCTNGIIRHYTAETNWDVNDLSKFIYSWPTNKYLNIYIVKSLNILATAYTFLPGTIIPPSADAIVCMANSCGSIGTSNLLNSRTLTHEVGHWFSLQHIWGTSNIPGVICGDDLVSDTPITKGFTTCVNTANTDVCTPGIFENIQNYMDYSPCKLMFTNGQAVRMLSCINSTLNGRNNLSTASNLQATGVTSVVPNCFPLVELSTPATKTICAGTTLSINSYTSNANVTNYSWIVLSGATISNPTGANTTITFNNAGTYSVSCVVTNGSFSNLATTIVTVLNAAPQISGAYVESFETPSLPLNWSVINESTTSELWSISNLSASAGLQSMFINTENLSGESVEILQTPSYDFLNNQGSTFTFMYAYARQSATHNDILKIQASKDCGGTWSDIYTFNSAIMALNSGGISSTLFIPASDDQWKFYDVTAHPNFVNFSNESNVIFRFYFKEDALGFGNRIYLDQINFTSPTGLNEFTKSIALNLAPNPTTSNFKVNFTLSEPKIVKVTITTVSGSSVIERAEKLYDSGNQSLEFNLGDVVSAGIYFVNIEFDGVKTSKKLIVSN